jgi:hypothetical protein
MAVLPQAPLVLAANRFWRTTPGLWVESDFLAMICFPIFINFYKQQTPFERCSGQNKGGDL